MILCDLPYGTTACKWDTIIPFEPLWVQYKRIIKDNGAIVLTASQPFTSALVMSNIKMFKYEWIWEKQKAANFMSLKYQPAKYHENIVVFSKNKASYYPIMWKVDDGKIDKRKNVIDCVNPKDSHYGTMKIKVRKKDNGTRYPKSILKINKSINKNIHPTQKPVALFEYLIKTYTNKYDTVLDNCAGSGTTGVACQNLNRKFILIEKEQKYIDIIKKRLSQGVLNI